MYYYFVAEHFVARLSNRRQKDAARRRLDEMANYIVFEEYSQILMFVIYKTKDEQLIDELILNSQLLFETASPCRLEEDMAFAGVHSSTDVQLSLPSESVYDNRVKRRQAMSEKPVDLFGSAQEKVRYSEDLDPATQLQFGFKTIQMLGRVARNFPGSLEVETKTNLAVSTFSVALRLLGRVFTETENEWKDIQERFINTAREEDPSDSEAVLKMRADAYIHSIVTFCSFLTIKIVSQAIGSTKLTEVYRRAKEQLGEAASTLLIDMSIKLDFNRTIPSEELFHLDRLFTENPIARRLLRMLVFQRLVYLPLSDRNLRQEVCSRFKIDGANPAIQLINSQPVTTSNRKRLN